MKRLSFLLPALFALYPVMSLYSANLYQLTVVDILGPAVLLPTAAMGAAFLLGALIGSTRASATIVSMAVILLFSYGRALELLGGHESGMSSDLLGLFAVVFLAFAYTAARCRRNVRLPFGLFVVVGIGLLVQPAFAIVTYQRPVPGTAAGVQLPVPRFSFPEHLPDIYYIILDGYGREDVLAADYDHDNSAFLSRLAARGFYVANRSRANYNQTHLSLASSLNLTYLDGMAEALGAGQADRTMLKRLIQDNSLARWLRRSGYHYITFSTGYLDAELGTADAYYGGPWAPSQFEGALLGTTPLPVVSRFQYDRHRDRLLYAFEHIPKIAELPGPKFVFAHIIAPHHPFVFNDWGEPVSPERPFSLADDLYFMRDPSRRLDYVQAYGRQLDYVNAMTIHMLDQILARYAERPIIVLQADHGPGLGWNDPTAGNERERMGILSAYHLPGGNADLYSRISPVNSFRLILRYYFGADLDLLPDRSYSSTWLNPYAFVLVAGD